MSFVPKFRTSDCITLDDIRGSGFSIRQKTPISQIAYMFKIVLLVIGGVSVVLYWNSEIGLSLCLVVGSVTYFLGKRLDQLQKIQQADEFTLALFSSALAKGLSFSLIVRHDGSIIHLNHAFRELFPSLVEQGNLNLRTFFEEQGVTPENQHILLGLVASGQEGARTVTLETGPEKQTESLAITVEPIDRPSGFMLIRAKE